MRTSVRQLVAVLGLALAMVATTAAQSLGDLAKKEAARRQAVKAHGKVLTTDSIQRVPAPPPPPATASGAPDKAEAEAGTEPKPPEDRKAQEATWRARMQSAREALQRSETFAEALQSRINGLTTDFTSRDDPAQRAVIANNRDKALAELARVKNEIVQQTKAIAGIQEEARRSGIPAGWVR